MESVPDIGQKQPVYETTWLQGIVEFNARKTSDDGVILTYVLGNGHQYALPLNGRTLELTRQAVSPVTVVSGDAMPRRNGHGT